MAVRGSHFVLLMVSPMVFVVCLFVYAIWFSFSEERAAAGAEALFLQKVKELGAAASDYEGPSRSWDSGGLSVSFCWRPIRKDLDSLCAIFIKHNSKLELYRVKQNPYRYERVSMITPSDGLGRVFEKIV